MRSVVFLSAVVLALCLSRFASAACTNNSECTSAAPFCSNQTCVSCLVNSHCNSSAPHCTNQGTCAASPNCGCTAYTNSPVCSSTKCVQCANNTQCASGICDTTLKVCRPPATCTNSTVCAGTDRPVCNGAGKCVECSSDSDCSAAFPTCTAAGICSAQKLSPILMCSKNATAGKRTLYTAFSADSDVDLVYPVGSRNALYVFGQNVLLNSNERFTLAANTRSHYYPQAFEELEISVDAQVVWYLDGSVSTLTLNSSSDCPINVSFFVKVANLTFVSENEQNITDTIASALGVDPTDVSINVNVNKRSVQQSAGQFEVTVANGFDAVLAFLNDPTALTDALSTVGVAVEGVQGAILAGEPTPVFDSATPVAPVASPSATPDAAPVDAPVASPDAVPVTPVTVFPPSNSVTPSTDGVVATPGALDSGIIVAIVVVCVVVAAAVIIIAVVVSRNKKKKSGGGSSSRMERGSATELKETGSSATVTTANPAKKVESESSDEDEESGEDEDSSDEDEESGEDEESVSEVSGSGSGSNEGSSSAEGSGSNEGSSDSS